MPSPPITAMRCVMVPSCPVPGKRKSRPDGTARRRTAGRPRALANDDYLGRGGCHVVQSPESRTAPSTPAGTLRAMTHAHALSRAAYERLQAELEDLTTRGRIEIALAIERARELGDLSENGDY